MAEEQYVGKEQFGEFVKRMEQGFFHVGERFDDQNRNADRRFEDLIQSMNQRFDDQNRNADRRFEDLIQSMNQRFDGLDKRMGDMRTLMLALYTPMAVAIIGAAVKVIFFLK